MGIQQVQDPAATSAAPALVRKSGSIVGKIFFAFSGAAMTLLLSQGGSLLFIGAGVLLSFIVCLIVAFRFSLLERALKKPTLLPLLLAVVLTGYVALLYRAEFAKTANEVIVSFLTASPLLALAGVARAALPTIVCVFALYAFFVLRSGGAVLSALARVLLSCGAALSADWSHFCDDGDRAGLSPQHSLLWQRSPV